MVESIYEFDEIKVLDGGFGSQISKRVGQSVDGDVLWSSRLLATNKEAVISTHLDFLRAGSDVIGTNTYQASIEGFVKYLNLSRDQSYELIKEAVDLAKTARDTYILENPYRKLALVAGSVGPYGASLHDGSEYTGTYRDTVTKEILKEWHRPRIDALVEGGVNLLAFETIPCKIEAEVLLEMLKDYPEMKAWLSFNCKNGTSLASGESFLESVNHCHNINPTQLLAVGVNCVSPIFVEELIAGINKDRKADEAIPLIVYPNSGEDYDKEQGRLFSFIVALFSANINYIFSWVAKENCPSIETYVAKWLDSGVKWIGGCCRMYDTDIKLIRQNVQHWIESK